MHQEYLSFDRPPAPSREVEEPPLTIAERFERFHEAHPDVFELFRRFAEEARAAGLERFGAKAIFERIRWHYQVSSAGETPMLNNVFTPYYARLLMETCPEFRGFFETRQLKSE